MATGWQGNFWNLFAGTWRPRSGVTEASIGTAEDPQTGVPTAGYNAPRNGTRACLSAGLSPIEKRRSYEATTSSRVAAEPLWK